MSHVLQAGTAKQMIYSVEFVVLKCIIAWYSTIYRLCKTLASLKPDRYARADQQNAIQ